MTSPNGAKSAGLRLVAWMRRFPAKVLGVLVEGLIVGDEVFGEEVLDARPDRRVLCSRLGGLCLWFGNGWSFLSRRHCEMGRRRQWNVEGEAYLPPLYVLIPVHVVSGMTDV
jgi:hypothetical protein